VPTTKRNKNKIQAMKIIILRNIEGKTRKDRIRNKIDRVRQGMITMVWPSKKMHITRIPRRALKLNF
jgi:hypothetical protein